VTGTFGNLKIQYDRTIPTQYSIFYVEAITRGLKKIVQRVQITVCAYTGASKVVPPSDSLYQLVDRGSTGNSANINFGSWVI